LQQVGDFVLLGGGSHADAMKMTPRELTAMIIVLGSKRGGKYDTKHNRWIEKPTVW